MIVEASTIYKMIQQMQSKFTKDPCRRFITSFNLMDASWTNSGTLQSPNMSTITTFWAIGLDILMYSMINMK